METFVVLTMMLLTQASDPTCLAISYGWWHPVLVQRKSNCILLPSAHMEIMKQGISKLLGSWPKSSPPDSQVQRPMPNHSQALGNIDRNTINGPPTRILSWAASDRIFRYLMFFLLLEGTYRFFTGSNSLLRGDTLRKRAATSSMLFAILEMPLATFGLYTISRRSVATSVTKIVTLGFMILSITLLPVLYFSVRSTDQVADSLNSQCMLYPPFYNENVTRREAIHLCTRRIANVRLANHFLDFVRLLLQILIIRLVLLWRKNAAQQLDEDVMLNNDTLDLHPHIQYSYPQTALLHSGYSFASPIIAQDTQVAPPYQQRANNASESVSVTRSGDSVSPSTRPPTYVSNRNVFNSEDANLPETLPSNKDRQ